MSEQYYIPLSQFMDICRWNVDQIDQAYVNGLRLFGKVRSESFGLYVCKHEPVLNDMGGWTALQLYFEVLCTEERRED